MINKENVNTNEIPSCSYYAFSVEIGLSTKQKKIYR